MRKRNPITQIRYYCEQLLKEIDADSIEMNYKDEILTIYPLKDNKPYDFDIVIKNDRNTKPKKLTFNCNGKIKSFKSISDASKKLKISKPTITNLINGKTKRSYSMEYDKIEGKLITPNPSAVDVDKIEDSLEELRHRMTQEAEWSLLAKAVILFCEKRLEIKNGKVIIKE